MKIQAEYNEIMLSNTRNITHPRNDVGRKYSSRGKNIFAKMVWKLLPDLFFNNNLYKGGILLQILIEFQIKRCSVKACLQRNILVNVLVYSPLTLCKFTITANAEI